MSFREKLKLRADLILHISKTVIYCALITALIWVMKPYIFDVMFQLIILPNRTGFDVLLADTVPFLIIFVTWMVGYRKVKKRYLQFKSELENALSTQD